MEILDDYDLTSLNTFGVSARTRYFTVLENEAQIPELFNSEIFKNNEKLFIGGGSNILFTKDWGGIVIQNKLMGIEIIKQDEENVWIKSMGGEVWHDLVLHAVEHGYWGIENLSLVPGTVGAAPMQNIGAYGAELKDTLENLEAYEIEIKDGKSEKRIFDNQECYFGYRESIFKNVVKGKYFITAITLKLSKKEKRNIEYKILKNYLDEHKITNPSLVEISDAVCAIRRSKLPDPKVLGNAGSFFKNVFVSKVEIDRLTKDYPDMPYFEEELTSPPTPLLNKERVEIKYKIPAGWLIEQCGFKGKRVGNVGMHEKQALVLVNYGGASGLELYEFAKSVMDAVHEKFGLSITKEVNLI